MKIEKFENKKIQAYLDLTLKMAQEHSKGKWRYADAEDFFNELKRRKEQAAAASAMADPRTDSKMSSSVHSPLKGESAL